MSNGPILEMHPAWCAHRWPHRGHECSAIHRRDCDCLPAPRPVVPSPEVVASQLLSRFVPEVIDTAQLAARYDVNPKTPTRWIKDNRMGPEGDVWFRTPGGHLRFRLRRLEEMEREGWRPGG